MLYINELKKEVHKFHNKLRELNLSDVHKLMFISAIFLTNECQTDELITKHYLRNGIKNSLSKYGLDKRQIEMNIKEYDFIQEIANEKSINNLVKEVYNTISKKEYKDIDILNVYYEELLKYQNNDSKSLGIVLTPDDIVSLMIKLADINGNDIFLDLCCGTGSFICEALKYKPKTCIGCELQNRLYQLSITNMIIRGTKKEKCEIINGDCFNYNFEKINNKPTKSVINPPFSMKNKELKELEFVKKQINSIEKSGRIVAIFPVSCLNANEKQLKEDITNNCVIKMIINLNNKVFYPSAGVKCCIIVLDKVGKHNYKKDKVRFINFENDGYIIEKQKGRCRTDDYSLIWKEIIEITNGKNINSTNIKYFDKFIDIEDDWNYSYYDSEKRDSLNLVDLRMKKLNFEYIKQKNSIKLNEQNSIINFKRTKNFYIKELFNISKGKCSIKNSEPGIYPLITSCSTNNGISKYVSKYLFESGNLTLSKNGNVGDCFYQNWKFDATTDVYILEPKLERFKEEKIGIFIATTIENAIKGRYDWGYKLNDLRLSKEKIQLPINENETIDYECILKLI